MLKSRIWFLSKVFRIENFDVTGVRRGSGQEDQKSKLSPFSLKKRIAIALVICILISTFVGFSLLRLVETKIVDNAHVFSSQSLINSSAETIAQTLFRMICSFERHHGCQVRITNHSGTLMAQVPTVQLTKTDHFFTPIFTLHWVYEHIEFDPPLHASIVVSPSLKNWLFWLSLGAVIGLLFFSITLLVLFQFDREKIRHQLELTQLTLHAQGAQAALGAMASQVAHDIRSPLAALEAVVAGSAKLPEDQRILVRSAVSRIRDIANTLLERNRAAMKAKTIHNGALPATAPSQEPSPPSVQLISSLIEPLVSEKRMQFRSKGGIEIDAILNASSYGLFAKVESLEFKRVLSNLINNAVEALGERGRVEVALTRVENEVRITLEDNGKGIPKELLARLGQRGETHGKAGGSGLGLYHARTQMEAWGGRFEIISEEGRGTKLILSLPVVLPSSWFLSQITVSAESTVVILDDDTSIHQIWKGRLESLGVGAPVSLLFFSSGPELERWVKQTQRAAQEILYLCDYELLGEKETGLDLIERLGIERQAVLVTSRFEESPVRERCEKLGIKLLPKGLAAFVPIQIALPKQKWDAILIDDDPLVHMTWKAQADRCKKSLLAFTSADDFLKESGAIDPFCVIYIDSNLGNGIRGEEVARRIYELGFSEIYLATGYEAEKFASMPHLKGVVGKDPPF